MAKSLTRFGILAAFCLIAGSCDFPGSGDGDGSGGPDSSAYENHPPSIGLGSHTVRMKEGESKSITLKATDPDGDPVHFSVLNLDSLRALFPDGSKAITILAKGDSLIIGFVPGEAEGSYRFRIAAMDDAGGIAVEYLTIEVGQVNHAPAVSLTGPTSGSAYEIREGRTLTFKVDARDEDGDRVTLQPLDNPPWPRYGQGSYDTRTGDFVFAPSFQAAAAGSAALPELVFRARDDGKHPQTGQAAAQLTVLDSNSAPAWNAPYAAVQGWVGREMSLDLAPLFGGDAEGDAVAFSARPGTADRGAMRWSYTPGPGDAGRRECIITASDSHAPSASADLTVILYIAGAPGGSYVEITSPVNGLVTNATVLPVRWSIGGQEQADQTSEALAVEGPNLIRRSYADPLGNLLSDSIYVVRDTRRPPAPAVNVPARTNNPRPMWTWAGGVEGAGAFRFALDNPDPDAAGGEVPYTYFIPGYDLPEGTHVLYVQERDEAGNWSDPGAAAVEVDYTPPAVRILSPASGQWVFGDYVEVRWSVDGVEQFTQNGEYVPAGGAAWIRREAVDDLGNRGADSVYVFPITGP
jgi:hypothetical protein